jgi:hypothetical protein
MAAINSHPYKEMATTWYHRVEPDLDRSAQHVIAALRATPCEFVSALTLVIVFAVCLTNGFNLSQRTEISFIVVLAAATILAAWSFLFADHGFMRKVWAISAIAGNLFLIAFI